MSVIFTKHSRERLRERGISEVWIGQTVKTPDSSYAGKNKGTTEFVKRFGEKKITVIAHRSESGAWVVVSGWMDPPLPGTRDAHHQSYYQRYRKAGFIGKFWYLFLRQLGWW